MHDDLTDPIVRAPDRHVNAAGVEVDIRYFRSNVNPDGTINRSDYTPYVFENDELVSIGWESLEARSRRDEEEPR